MSDILFIINNFLKLRYLHTPNVRLIFIVAYSIILFNKKLLIHTKTICTFILNVMAFKP